MNSDSDSTGRRAVHHLQGTVERGSFAPGSKSAQQTCFLRTADARYRLRRRYGPSFGDSSFDALVGRRVECDGSIVSELLLVDRIGPID